MQIAHMSSTNTDNLLRNILDRLQKVEGVKTDAALLAMLKTTQSNLSSWKQRGTIPYAYLDDYCQRTGNSMDYILYGKGSAHGVAEETSHYNTSAPVYKIASQVYDALTESRQNISPAQFEQCVKLLHENMLSSKESEISYKKVIEFLKLALAAASMGTDASDLSAAIDDIAAAIDELGEEEQQEAKGVLTRLRNLIVHQPKAAQ